MTNTLSHELLTPLNCVINLSEHLMETANEEIKEMQTLAKTSTLKANSSKQQEKIGKCQAKAEQYELIWSSGRIL